MPVSLPTFIIGRKIDVKNIFSTLNFSQKLENKNNLKKTNLGSAYALKNKKTRYYSYMDKISKFESVIRIKSFSLPRRGPAVKANVFYLHFLIWSVNE